METKICSKCKIEKSTEEFKKVKQNSDGLHSWCCECSKNYNKVYQKNEDRILFKKRTKNDKPKNDNGCKKTDNTKKYIPYKDENIKVEIETIERETDTLILTI